MANVSDPPTGATAPPSPQVDLADPATRAEWLARACEHTADLIAAALDATAPPGLRMLGRKGAREIITETAGVLTANFAAVGLDLDAPPMGLMPRRRGRGEERQK